MSFRALRGPMTVVTAAAVSSPMLPHVLAGDMQLSSALLRFLVVMGLCWVGFTALADLAGSYEAGSRPRPPAKVRHGSEDPAKHGPSAGDGLGSRGLGGPGGG